MIVTKFGGTSVADAQRIGAVAEIVRGRLHARPVVVVSALAGVTDLLVHAVDAARRNDLEGLDPILADLERRHRWAIGGAVDDPRRRHDLSLEVQRLFEELRQLLRSVRVLGEGTPRSADALLSYGEDLSSRIVEAALEDRGVAARWVDARTVVRTDDRHGAAEPDVEEVARACRRFLAPLISEGVVPVLGGFVGASAAGRTTTLGRGGSDTSAAVLGCALGADAVEIWTDVDGVLSADPRLVPGARTLPSVAFAEAAELAHYGAKVLHPASIAPAVRRQIPVRVLNTLRPQHPGTEITDEPREGAPGVVSVASRAPVTVIRVANRKMRAEPGFAPRVLDALHGAGVAPDLLVSTGLALGAAVSDPVDPGDVERRLGGEASVVAEEGRAVACVVGSGLARSADIRARVLAALTALDPEMVAAGAASASLAAVVRADRLGESVRALHARFLECEVGR